MKRTHIIFGFLFFLICNYWFKFPLEVSVFAFIGAMIPDLDLKFMHRKLFHNLWFLTILDIGLLFFKFSQMTIIVFSLGFISHLLADSMTKKGISFLWPIRFPHVEGGITTGGWKEYIFAFLILVGIVLILWGIDFISNFEGMRINLFSTFFKF